MHGKTHCASIIPSLLHSWPTTYFTNIWTCAGTCMHTHTHTHIHTQFFFFPSPLISKEDLALKNWCFWTVVLEKTLAQKWKDMHSNPVSQWKTSDCFYLSLSGFRLLSCYAEGQDPKYSWWGWKVTFSVASHEWLCSSRYHERMTT